MANTFYTAFSVLKSYIDKQGLTVVNFAMQECSLDRIVMWVDENGAGITHFVCMKVSPTQFLLWWYGSDYAEIGRTSLDYADVNTPETIQSVSELESKSYSPDYNRD